MRKQQYVLVFAVTLLFALAMAAQTSSASGTSQTGSDQSSMQSTSPQSSTSQGSTSDMGSQTSSSSATRSGKEKTVDGCIVRQQTDYFIVPRKGQPMRVSGSDISSHVGHHVKVHGTEEAGTMGASATGTGGTSGSMTSAGSKTEAQESGSMGSTSAAGASSKEIVAERIDMVSETCPANIQKNVDASGMGSGSTPSTPQ